MDGQRARGWLQDLPHIPDLWPYLRCHRGSGKPGRAVALPEEALKVCGTVVFSSSQLGMFPALECVGVMG